MTDRNTIKAILIDPDTATFRHVEYADYRDIYNLIDCDTFDIAGLDNGHSVYVDDEGLLVGKPMFQIEGYPQALAGKGLLVGPVDDAGNDTDCTMDDPQAQAVIPMKVFPPGEIVLVPVAPITKEEKAQ